jgi:hypothetical protein
MPQGDHLREQVHGSYHVVEFTGMKVALSHVFGLSNHRVGEGPSQVFSRTTTPELSSGVVLQYGPPENRIEEAVGFSVSNDSRWDKVAHRIAGIRQPVGFFSTRSRAKKLVVRWSLMSPAAAISSHHDHVTRLKLFTDIGSVFG